MLSFDSFFNVNNVNKVTKLAFLELRITFLLAHYILIFLVKPQCEIQDLDTENLRRSTISNSYNHKTYVTKNEWETLSINFLSRPTCLLSTAVNELHTLYLLMFFFLFWKGLFSRDYSDQNSSKNID